MSKPIFNSLGSNYSTEFVTAALGQLFVPNHSALQKLKQKLEAQFQGQATLLYKGRDAIEFALRSQGIGIGDQVITQAFTCHAIEEAITRTGADTMYADLEQATLNPSIRTLETALTQAPQAKAVIIQHTLGYPADIQNIAKWCHSHHLVLIEDLAQAYGGTDQDQQPLGKHGDIVILSFGRDKIIDAVSGGACIIKTGRLTPGLEQSSALPTVPWMIVARDMLYPLITSLIKSTFTLGIGKVIAKVARLVGLLTSPVAAPLSTMAQLPAAHATLILRQLERVASELDHRQQIALRYHQALATNPRLQPLVTEVQIYHASNQRYSFVHDQPTEVVANFKAKNVHIADRWYRQPVDSGSLNLPSVYQPGSCPTAEWLASHIINLPTHHQLAQEDVQRIATELATL